MSDNYEWEDEPEEDEVKQSLKESLSPKSIYDLPISKRFLKTTKGLFYEHRFHTTVKEKAPYTLGNLDFERDGHVYKSMYMIYMQCDSEYEAAIRLLGSYPHWVKLKRCSWFQDYVESWERERNIRDEAIARSTLIKLAECGNVSAARAIYSNAEKTKGKAGRPEKGGSRKDSTGVDELDEMLGRSTAADK